MPIRRRLFVGSFVSLLAGCGSQSTPVPSERESSPTRQPSATADGRTAISRTVTPSDGASGSVTVVNGGSDDRYVTVAVERRGETVFVDSRIVRTGTSQQFDAVVSESGEYRVVVDTADGTRGRFDWSVTEAFGDLRVDVEESVTFSRLVRCDPDCRAVSLGGSATGYPEGGFDPRGRRAGSRLLVRNDAAAARRVRVRVAEGAALDYRYRVPATTTLEIPVPQRSGETRVDVERLDGRETETYQWSMETSPVLHAIVGTALRFTCGERTRDVQLLNEDDVPHSLRVEVTGSAGEQLFAGTYDLAPGETVREEAVVSTAGDYGLALATERSSASYEWSTCPPRGPVYVVVRADGTVAVPV